MKNVQKKIPSFTLNSFKYHTLLSILNKTILFSKCLNDSRNHIHEANPSIEIVKVYSTRISKDMFFGAINNIFLNSTKDNDISLGKPKIDNDRLRLQHIIVYILHYKESDLISRSTSQGCLNSQLFSVIPTITFVEIFFRVLYDQ